MLGGHTFRRAFFTGAVALVVLPVAAAPTLDVPMERKLITVKILVGLKDAEPSIWEGTYHLSEGRVVATDGWRFAQDDYATPTNYKCEVRRFYPRFWQMRGRDPSKLPLEPNGFLLTCSAVSQAATLEVTTPKGDFTVPLGSLGYGGAQRKLEGNVEFQRVPTYRTVVKASTEDGYPAAVAGPGNALFVAYLAFTHGVGFESRPPIKEMPTDFASLGEPTGGDQVRFTEMNGDRWTEPVALTEKGGDLFGTAIAADGQGRTWVFWAANVDENWDVFAKIRTDGKWAEAIRLTSAPGSDFNVVAVTDSEGRVWVAWQSLTRGNADLYAARQEGDTFGKPVVVASGSANEWEPAIAASADGQVAVAWDSYQRGDYDVLARVWRGGKWGSVRRLTDSAQNEARASAAFDGQNRLWVAYEVSPEGWGKDSGPYDQTPRKTALYKSREIGLKVLQGDKLFAPEADVNLSMPMPDGNPRWPKSQKRFLAATPRVTAGAEGRIWLSARIRWTRFESFVGGDWLTFLTTPEGDTWRTAFMVPGSDGFLHEPSALVPAPGSGLYAVSTTDGRFHSAAFFGPGVPKARQRSKDAPPACTRDYPTYQDWQFNREISVADTGAVRQPDEDCKLVEVQPESEATPSSDAQDEARQVAAIREYRAELNGKPVRVWRGEFHRHTELSSDGSGDGTLFDMWRYGIDMASLDWIGCGDHDNGSREFHWWLTQKTTSLFTMPGAFTPMYTYERSCNYPDGHRNVVFAERGVRPLARLQGGAGEALDNLPADAKRPSAPDTLMLYKYLGAFGGVCASHTSGTDMGTDWRDNDPKVEPIVEIYQGDRNSYERSDAPRANSADYSLGGWRPLGFVSRALLKGYRLGFQSSSDHISTHMSYCNVWVEEPTREAILDAMKKRHVYGATDNIIADVRSGDHFMGDEFTVSKPPSLHVKLVGTAPFAEVVVVKDNVYVYSSRPNKAEVEFDWTDADAQRGKTSYYYIRGLQVGEKETRKIKSLQGGDLDKEFDNGEIVWASPMWITYAP